MNNLKIICGYTVLMLAVPLGVWLVDYAWLPENALNFHAAIPYLLILTDTGSPPYAVGTSLLLLAILTGLLRQWLNWRAVVIMCLLSLGITQGIKSAMKRAFQEPRPFVTALAVSGSLRAPADFYRLPDAEQNALMSAQAKGMDTRLAAHQAGHHDYSFPSGHTIFAVSWLLLFAGFGCRARVCAAMAAWAAAVLLSRVLLGMHYPIDLFVSTLIAGVVHAGLFVGVLPRLQKRFPILNQELKP